MTNELHISTTKTPTIRFFGCGGAGINIINLLIKFHPELQDIVCKLDTSTANMSSLNDVVVLTDGQGSGKIKRTHVEELREKISSLEQFVDDIPDISIIIASTSGGSGNTLSTLLLSELKRRGSQPIVFLIGDTSSKIDNDNTINTLKSYTHTANINSIYLPVSIYHNNDTSRSKVDKQLIQDLYLLLRILTVNTLEVDRNDRINWLNASKTNNADFGIVDIFVYSTLDTSQLPKDDNVCYDSVLRLNCNKANDETVSISEVGNISLFVKEGINVSNEFPHALIGLISRDSQKLFKLMDVCVANLTKYNKINKQRDSSSRRIEVNSNDPDLIV